jgi:predicted ATPase/class 3 adenylate cyclase
MPDLPSGTVTFLFTDIEGSTALWERDRQAMAAAAKRHIALLRTAIEAHEGVLFKVVGDAVQAAFPTAPQAVAASVEGQRALLTEDWGKIGPLTVRMALHAGEAVPDNRGDYLAAPLNRLSRLLSTGYGGQILLSQTVQQLTRGALPDGIALRDLGEHRLRDLLEPERVFQLLHPDLPDQFPPLKSLESAPNNLPRQPTPFLGREREVGDVVGLLQKDDVQLATLVGPGGTGKTRLALQAAAELLDDFRDGVFFVPLASLSDPELVLATIATTLGIREEGGQPLGERLRDFLATKQLLLVLDNVEHLAAAAPAVGELLGGSAGVKVLATSRVPLRLRAEREYPVPPLGLPRRKPPPTADQLSQYEAVRLFIDRAQAVKPVFGVDNENAPAIAEICHRLDGLPLAIELAAARIRLLSPQAMLSRLEQRLPMLTGGARDAPERQRTLRSTIAWSYDLLEPVEQQVFQRLAVFAGGITLDAAEAVANPDGHLDIFGSLERLVEQSLLRQEEVLDGEPRLGMLETIREFALEQLTLTGEEVNARRRHAAWCHELAERVDRQLGGPYHRLAMDRLEVEHDNVRAALAWHLEQGAAEEGLRLTATLWRFLADRGHLSEGRQWQERLLALDSCLPPRVRTDALWLAAYLAFFSGDYPAVASFLEESLRLARQSADELAIAKASFLLGSLPEDDSDSGRNTALLEEALARFRALGSSWWVAETMQSLGRAARMRGDLAAARARHLEELSLWQERGNTWGTAWALLSLGELTAQEGDTRQAVALLRQSLQLHADLGDHLGIYYCLLELGQWAAGGHPEAAARVLGAAAALREARGAQLQPEHHALHDRAVSQARSELGEAAFAAAWTTGRTLALETAVDEALALATEITANQRRDSHIDMPG